MEKNLKIKIYKTAMAMFYMEVKLGLPF